MSEIQRYDHYIAHADSDDPESRMGEAQSGDWVKFEDYEVLQQKLEQATLTHDYQQDQINYWNDISRQQAEENAALQQKLDAVLAENVALKAAIKDAHKCAEECEFNGEFCYVVPSCELEALGDCLDETPATDAILNEVRAEAIDDVASKAGNFGQQYKTGSAQWHKWKSTVMFLVGESAKFRAGSTEGGV